LTGICEAYKIADKATNTRHLLKGLIVKPTNTPEKNSAKRPYEKPELMEIVLEDYTEGKKAITVVETLTLGAAS
jgi:hypothetical protein